VSHSTVTKLIVMLYFCFGNEVEILQKLQPLVSQLLALYIFVDIYVRSIEL
jgi:hypothetical protein